MYSVFNLYGSTRLKGRLKEGGMHKFAKHEGPLMLDSGGFQFFKKIAYGEPIKKELTVEELAEIYMDCNLREGDYCVSLDMPPFYDLPMEKQVEMITQTTANFVKLREILPKNVGDKLVPVIHGWNEKTIRLSLEGAVSAKVVAIGGFFPVMLKKGGFAVKQLAMKFKIIMDLVREMSKDFENVRFHGLGASGQNPFHICSYAGIEQTDSSAWRQQAAYILLAFKELPLGYVGQQIRKSFKHPWKEEHDLALRDCDCPVCDGLSYNEKLEVLRINDETLDSQGNLLPGGGSLGFQLRCVHNVWHYLKEKLIAQTLSDKGGQIYYNYLKNRFRNSWRNKIFIETIKASRNQVTLERFFKDR